MMRGEQLPFQPSAVGGIFGGGEQKGQGWDDFDSEPEVEPLQNKRKMNTLDKAMERRRKGKEFLIRESPFPLFEYESQE
jgi:hypothetical protein